MVLARACSVHVLTQRRSLAKQHLLSLSAKTFIPPLLVVTLDCGMAKMKLDVGCGHNPKGDVNVDLFLDRPIATREGEQKVYEEFKKRDVKIPNFVCADCNNLPFRSQAFDEVVCHHLLEHVGVDLVQTCRELIRVAKGKVVISVPSEFCNTKYAQAHGGAWLHDKILTPEAFHILFRQFERKVKYSRRKWHHIRPPSKIVTFLLCRVPSWLPCPVPSEIVVEVYKA